MSRVFCRVFWRNFAILDISRARLYTDQKILEHGCNLNTIKRAVSILNHIGTTEGRSGVTEIGKALKLSKGTVSRLLSQLEAEELVIQDPETQRYSLGVKIFEIGGLAQSNLDLRTASLPYMHQLRDIIGETVTLNLRVGFDRMYIEQVQGIHEVRQVPELGKRVPLWCGAGGKVILAHLGTSEIEDVLENLRKLGTQVLASGQSLDPSKLQYELEQVRKEHFLVTVGERLPSFCGVSAPIFGREHKVLGCLSVGGPLPRFSPEQGRRWGPSLSSAARKISLALGDLSSEH